MPRSLAKMVLLASAIGFSPMLCQGGEAPSVDVLRAVAGKEKSSAEFLAFLERYDFSENPKRDNSWGSGFGILIEIDAENRVWIGIRPEDDGMDRRSVPQGFEAGDSLADIEARKGPPLNVRDLGKGTVELDYEGLMVVMLRGELFEIWLPGRVEKAPPAGSK